MVPITSNLKALQGLLTKSNLREIDLETSCMYLMFCYISLHETYKDTNYILILRYKKGENEAQYLLYKKQ